MAQARDYRKSLADMSDEERVEVAPSAVNFQDSFLARNKDKDVLSTKAAEFIADIIPGISTVSTARDIKEELQKDDPSYGRAGLMVAGEVAGLVPAAGPVAKTMVRGLGDKVTKSISSIKEGVPTVEAAGLSDEAIDMWRKDNATSDDFRKKLKGRNEELQELAKGVGEGRVFTSTYRKRSDELRPIRTVTEVPKPASFVEAVSALNAGKRKKPMVGLNVSIPEGDIITARLDIDAYTDYDVWVPTLTHPELKTVYKPSVVLKDVTFITPESGALKKARKVAEGGNKAPFAVMTGSFVNKTDDEAFELAKDVFDSDEWTQLGYDPTRRGFFYDRKTGEAVVSASEVIQVGHLVLAKQAKKIDPEIFSFNEGGEVMEDQGQGNAQMEMELMLKEQVDPVSGNSAPLGSTPEEVRDDVPINASAGEFMINAQTVNYFGEEFFNNLQETAAEGWQRIKEGKESFFRDDELEVAEVDDVPTDEVQSMAYGGTVRGYAEGDEITDEIANKEVPKPVGGGYGGYGGTGSIFTGFEMRTVKDPVTGRTKKVAFFNGRPLTALKSYVDVSTEGETEEVAPAAQTREVKDPRPQYRDTDPTFRNKEVTNWTKQDFSSYNDSMVEGKEGQLSNSDMGLLQIVGNRIIPGGGFALAKLSQTESLKQAKKVYERTSDLIEGGVSTAEILAANKASFNAAKNLEGQTVFDSIGLGFLDGSTKNVLPDTSMFAGVYTVPKVGTTKNAAATAYLAAKQKDTRDAAKKSKDAIDKAVKLRAYSDSIQGRNQDDPFDDLKLGEKHRAAMAASEAGREATRLKQEETGVTSFFGNKDNPSGPFGSAKEENDEDETKQGPSFDDSALGK